MTFRWLLWRGSAQAFPSGEGGRKIGSSEPIFLTEEVLPQVFAADSRYLLLHTAPLLPLSGHPPQRGGHRATVKGSDLSAASGGRSEGSEWQRSTAAEALLRRKQMSGTATGSPLRESCIHHFKLQGTSKNSPFAIWADLLPQLCVAKIPQYTKYSGISAT